MQHVLSMYVYLTVCCLTFVCRTLVSEPDDEMFAFGDDDDDDEQIVVEKPKPKRSAGSAEKSKVKANLVATAAGDKESRGVQDASVAAKPRFVAARKVAPKHLATHHLVRTTPSQGKPSSCRFQRIQMCSTPSIVLFQTSLVSASL